MDELATALEPLAKVLATLSNKAGEILTEIEQETKSASLDYQRQISATSDNLGMVVRAAEQATPSYRAANRLDWTHFALVIATGLLSAMLVSGSWVWFGPQKCGPETSCANRVLQRNRPQTDSGGRRNTAPGLRM